MIPLSYSYRHDVVPSRFSNVTDIQAPQHQCSYLTCFIHVQQTYNALFDLSDQHNVNVVYFRLTTHGSRGNLQNIKYGPPRESNIKHPNDILNTTVTSSTTSASSSATSSISAITLSAAQSRLPRYSAPRLQHRELQLQHFNHS